MGLQPIAIVVQRYGETIRGGAEQHAAKLAALLAETQPVHILTTTAEDYRHWRQGFEAGRTSSTLGSGNGEGNGRSKGIEVLRFKVDHERSPLVFAMYHRLMIAATAIRTFWGQAPGANLWRRLCERMETLWYKLQGPYCPTLVTYLAQHQRDYQQVIFVTYLYYPTVMGAAALSVPYLLIPTLHDEPAKDFCHTAQLLAGASSLVVNSEAERQLAAFLGPFSAKAKVVGIHLEDSYFAAPFSAREEPPYLLYVGRIDEGKNLAALIAWYSESQFDPPVTLKLAGHDQGTVTIPENVTMLGQISDAEKLALMKGALAVVHPSRLESLALVALESMALGTPLLLHSGNEVFRAYIAAAPTARGFADQASFAEAVTELLKQPPTASDRQLGRDWVHNRYSAAAISAKFAQLLGQ